MSTQRIRALVLAAGMGERLRPLTEFLPKPLLPVLGRPVLEYSLQSLVEAGCEAAAVNLHHLGSTVRKEFGGAYAGMGITYSEESLLLGTLGAAGPLLDFLGEADLVVVVNGDSLCRWPLKKVLRAHQRSRSEATLLMSGRAAVSRFGGGVEIDKRGAIRSFRPSGDSPKGVKRKVFAGLHVFSPELLKKARVPLEGNRPADFVSDLYEPRLAAGGRIRGVSTRRDWHDLGTPERYRRGALDWARGSWRHRRWHRKWISPGARIGAEAKVTRSVVESGAVVEDGAVVDRSLVLAGAHVGGECHVRLSIIGPEAVLPNGTVVKNTMATAARAANPVRERDSVVGNLVYSSMKVGP